MARSPLGGPRETTHHTTNIRNALGDLGHADIANYVRCDYASDTTVGFVYEHAKVPWKPTDKEFVQADVPRQGYHTQPDYVQAASMLLVQL